MWRGGRGSLDTDTRNSNLLLHQGALEKRLNPSKRSREGGAGFIPQAAMIQCSAT